MRFHLSSEFYCINSAAKRHENMMPTRVYFTHEQIAIGTRENKTLDGDKNYPKMSGASVTNFHLTQA